MKKFKTWWDEFKQKVVRNKVFIALESATGIKTDKQFHFCFFGLLNVLLYLWVTLFPKLTELKVAPVVFSAVVAFVISLIVEGTQFWIYESKSPSDLEQYRRQSVWDIVANAAGILFTTLLIILL